MIWAGAADKGAMAGAWVAGAAMAEGGSELVGIGALWVVAPRRLQRCRLGLRGWLWACLLPAAGLRRRGAKAWGISGVRDATPIRTMPP